MKTNQLYSLATRKIRKLPIDNSILSADINKFFSDYNRMFTSNPNLWIKGGPARDALKAMIDPSYIPQAPRDIDLLICYTDPVKVKEIKDFFKATVPAISEEDMQVVSKPEDYLSALDLNINEVILRPDEIMFTDSAARDAYDLEINPSQYQLNPKKKEFIPPRIGLRGVLTALRNNYKINPLLLNSIKLSDEQNVLKHLFRAFETNVEDDFFEIVKQHVSFLDYPNAKEALKGLVSKYPEYISEDKRKKYEKFVSDINQIITLAERYYYLSKIANIILGKETALQIIQSLRDHYQLNGDYLFPINKDKLIPTLNDILPSGEITIKIANKHLPEEMKLDLDHNLIFYLQLEMPSYLEDLPPVKINSNKIKITVIKDIPEKNQFVIRANLVRTP